MTATAPRIHINGTSKEELLKQNEAALCTLQDAMAALQQAAPNGRDYYPIGDNAYSEASAQHTSRVERLQTIIVEIYQIMEEIDLQ